MKKCILSIIILCAFILPLFLSCTKEETGPGAGKKIKVVTTLFPLYDFARNVGGNLVQVGLLLPPGMEPHSFEPKPADIRAMNDADVLFYTGKSMEPWVEDVLKGISNKKLHVVDTSDGILLAENGALPDHHQSDQQSEGAQGHHHALGAKDPHIWLDLSNAQTMVENILNGFIAVDPENRQVYLNNAEAYSLQLSLLDKRYRDGLSSCRKDMLIHGGHFAFGYLARRYHIRYLSAYRGISPNTEPAPGDIIGLIRSVRAHHLDAVFFEELVLPSVADTIARETGAKLLMLHGAHNLSKNEWDQNVTFLSLMENNLKNLKIGLECE
jgi:zinc transport system substrate-binding protein